MLHQALIAIVMALAVLRAGGAGAGESPVEVSLSAARVVVSDDGTQELKPAGAVEPGDVLRYSAAYRNITDSALSGLVRGLPIPPGTQFVAGTARPAGVLVSLDGQQFAPPPLMREVDEGDGPKLVEVPASEYRYLRWPQTVLAPGAAVDIRADVRVLD